jgi:hypothetical protein
MVAVNVNKSALERAKELGIDMVYDNVIKGVKFKGRFRSSPLRQATI